MTKNSGKIMAKRKKGAKVQKQGKLRRGNSAKRGKPRKVANAAVAKAKPEPAPAKKAARKVKPVVETVAAEVIEQPVPGLTTVTEVEENVGK